jgi:hypothetical protein
VSDYTDEIMGAYRRYLADGTVTPLSDDAVGYIRHCLAKSLRNARMVGKLDDEVDVFDHQFFALLAVEIGQPERIPEFLIAVSLRGGKGGPT